MIDYINGLVTESTPAICVIECNGVGYEINVTLMDYPDLKEGEQKKLFIHESIREDAHVLYGFLTRRSRELFRLLIGVSGVGPNTGRLIMSSLSPEQLESTISSGQPAALKAVKGVGIKTAQRIIVDLKDKIKVSETAFNTSMPEGEAYEDSVAALVMLGFTSQQSRKALTAIFKENPSITTEKAIKQALTML